LLRRALLPIPLLVATPATAHEGSAPTSARTEPGAGSLAAFRLDPWVIVPLALAVALFAAGRSRLAARRRAGAVGPLRTAAFAGGVAAIFVALVSPVDRLSERYFSVHMGQHELLMLVAAPLLVLARPLVPFLAALPGRWQPRAVAAARSTPVAGAWTFLTAPLVAILLHAVVRWVWHLPLLFEAALANRGIHAIQHLLFLATAGLFWWSIVNGRYGRAGYGVAVLAVFATAAHTGLLGALLALAPAPLYRSYARALGPAALADQQLAGLVMWVLAGTLLTLVALALFAAWMGESARRARRAPP
jgi:putative membrane protein